MQTIDTNLFLMALDLIKEICNMDWSAPKPVSSIQTPLPTFKVQLGNNVELDCFAVYSAKELVEKLFSSLSTSFLDTFFTILAASFVSVRYCWTRLTIKCSSESLPPSPTEEEEEDLGFGNLFTDGDNASQEEPKDQKVMWLANWNYNSVCRMRLHLMLRKRFWISWRAHCFKARTFMWARQYATFLPNTTWTYSYSC